MTVIQDFRTTKKIQLKNLKDAEIEIYSGLLVKDVGFANNLNKNQDNIESLLKLLTVVIKDWNFTNEKNEKLPIDAATLGILSIEVINEIAEAVAAFVQEKKTA